MTMTSAEIRQLFLDYFTQHGHTIVNSSSLVPSDDPTLLFTNAGMVQFKDTFLGLEKRDYSRATTSQKCMRVAGKHSDLENVGPSPRHHTFFEMLGNFSFGDYFKEEAIERAWTFLTEVVKLPTERLWVSIYTDDDEAFEFWQAHVSPERILRFGKSENFWEMGDVGPCGPCSEIHYYYGDLDKQIPEGVNRDDEYLEIWNLVFMQFERDVNGELHPLPKPSIDTGMGLERLVSVLQGQTNNYDTDLFTPIMSRTQALLGHTDEQRQENYVAYRVIADHGRAITFMIGDGVMPGNEGRASVLRLILRRAARYGRMLGFDGPFLAQIADTVINEMGEHYIELTARRQFILNVITQEEERFLRTFNNGLELIAELVENLKAKGKSQIPGEEVFKLYATYGFPVDLTRLIADEEYGFTLDEKGYHKALEQHSQISGGKLGEIAVDMLQVYADLLAHLKETGQLPTSGVTHDPYHELTIESNIVAILRDGQTVDEASVGQMVEVVVATTPFYVESGGQVGDTGWISRPPSIPPSGEEQGAGLMTVSEVARPVGGLIVQRGVIDEGRLTVGQTVQVSVDESRRADIIRNHTATHILHRELRRALGDHVAQAGSLVAPDRLRFDFSHPQAVESTLLSQIEQAVNQTILADWSVSDRQQTYADLKEDIASGNIMALFGEKYGDVVRVVSIGDDEAVYSRELCGGTHVQTTGQIGSLTITSEGSAAAGVRRIEAVTGRAAQQLTQQRLTTLKETAAALSVQPEQVTERVSALVEQTQAQERTIKMLQRRLARANFEQMLSLTHEVKGVCYVSLVVDVPDVSLLREMSDWFKDALESAVIVLGATLNDKPIINVAVTEDLTKQGLHAGKMVKELAKAVGGGGGGKPTMAQAGGKDASKLSEALAMVGGLIEQAVR